MNNQIYISSSCFEFDKVDELFSYCRDNNWLNIELSGNLKFDKDYLAKIEQVKDFRFLVHNYFPAPKKAFVLNLASVDEVIRQKSLGHCKKAIKLCEKLRIPFYSVHVGFLTDLKPEDLGRKQSKLMFYDRKKGLELFEKSIRELLEYASKIDLLIENNVVSQENLVDGQNKHYLLADLRETLDFLNKINDDQLGLLVDLGHLKVSAQQLRFDKFEYIEELKSKIKAFHLSDNDGLGDQGLIFHNQSWFMSVLEQKQFAGLPKTIEVNNKYDVISLNQCIEIVSNL